MYREIREMEHRKVMYIFQPHDFNLKRHKDEERTIGAKPLELSISLDTFDYKNILNLCPQLCLSVFVQYLCNRFCALCADCNGKVRQ